MKLYASYGTFGYLNQIRINNPDHDLLQFSTSDSSVIIEETDDTTVLKEPIVYDVIESEGELNKDNFYATQFHPEKSAGIGEEILRNFLSLKA